MSNTSVTKDTFTCVALFKYEPKAPDELHLIKKDRLIRCKVSEKGWFTGFSVRLSKEGVFPDNFVKKVGESGDEPVYTKPSSTTNPIPPSKTEKPKPPSKFSASTKINPTTKNQKIYQAKFAYNADNPDELNLKKHDKIIFIEEVEDGWARGKVVNGDGKEGLYPTNFVEISEEVKELEQSKKGSSIKISPFDVKSSINRNSNSPFNDLLSNTSNTSSSNNFPISSKPMCVATFAYNGTQQDELSFKKGDRIILLSKDAGDPGWWKGSLNGKEGVFPDNFVKEDVGRKTVADISTRSNHPSGGLRVTAARSPTSNAPTISSATVTNENSSSGLTSQPSVIKDNFNKATRPKGPAGKRPPNRNNRPKASDKDDGSDDLWNSGKQDNKDQTEQNKSSEVLPNTQKSINVNLNDSDDEGLKNAPLAQSRVSIGERMQKISGNNPMSAAFADKAFHEKIKQRREATQQQVGSNDKDSDNNGKGDKPKECTKPSWMDRANKKASNNKDTLLLNGTISGSVSMSAKKRENNNPSPVNSNTSPESVKEKSNFLNKPLGAKSTTSQSIKQRAQMFGAKPANNNPSGNNNNPSSISITNSNLQPQEIMNNNNLNTSPVPRTSVKPSSLLPVNNKSIISGNHNVTTPSDVKRQSLATSPISPVQRNNNNKDVVFDDNKKDWTNLELYNLIKSQQKTITKLEKSLEGALDRISVLEKSSSRNYV